MGVAGKEGRESQGLAEAEVDLVEGSASPLEADSVQCVGSKWMEAGVYCLFLLTGITSWLLVNSIFVEMPSFISELPEGQALASQLNLIIQFSNAFPLLFVILKTRLRFGHSSVLIAALIVFGVLSSLWLAQLWDVTVALPSSGNERSVFLMVGTFAAGIVGCMSVVLYYPFAARYSARLVSAISLGMGLTGLISTGLGLLQDFTGMSVGMFFLVNAVLMAVGLVGYLVVCSDLVRIKTVEQPVAEVDEPADMAEEEQRRESMERAEWIEALEESGRQARERELAAQRSHERLLGCLAGFMNGNGWFLSINQVFNCFVLYFLMGAIPYAVADYEHGDDYLSWMYMGAMVSGSVGRFLCTFDACRFNNSPFLLACTAVQYVFGAFVAAQCFLGYQLWIPEDWIWTVVTTYVALAFVNGYEDTLLYQVAVVKQVGHHNIQRVTLFIGLSNQAGSFCGSLLAFVLVVVGWLHA